jgi:ankyrin repeat protein
MNLRHLISLNLLLSTHFCLFPAASAPSAKRQKTASDFEGMTQEELDARMHKAVSGGHIRQFDQALRAGANPNATNPSGNTAISVALDKKDPRFLDLSIQHGANVNAPNYQGESPLIEAIDKKSEIDAFRMLIAAQANVNYSDPKGQSPITAATRYKRTDVISLLTNANANLDVKEGDLTPVMIAARSGYPEGLKALMGEPSGEPSEKQKALVNARTNQGKTALHYAKLSTMPLLVQYNADINSPCNDLKTPLHDAYRSPEEIEQLLALGADVHRRDNQGDTALSLVRKNNFSEAGKASRLLLRAGANPKDLASLTSFSPHSDRLNRGENIACSSTFGKCASLLDYQTAKLELLNIALSMGIPITRRHIADENSLGLLKQEVATVGFKKELKDLFNDENIVANVSRNNNGTYGKIASCLFAYFYNPRDQFKRP